ncbi:MAG: hypothetical protein HUN04_12525 [Desulfobacter sp.]|nr:MAG: hypothetical protein HUN04_12525 [Desulfobacter sp.]
MNNKKPESWNDFFESDEKSDHDFLKDRNDDQPQERESINDLSQDKKAVGEQELLDIAHEKVIEAVSRTEHTIEKVDNCLDSLLKNHKTTKLTKRIKRG